MGGRAASKCSRRRHSRSVLAEGRGRARLQAPNIEQQFTANAFIVANPNLKPETSWSAEVGASMTVADGFQVSATYFQQRFFG
jgi:outer membrane receptor for ferrienterochelin and colicin